MAKNRKTPRSALAVDLRAAGRAVRVAALRDGNNGPKSWRQVNGRAKASKNACRGR